MSETSLVTGPLMREAKKLPGLICLRLNSGHVTVGGHHLKLNEKGTADLLVLLPEPLFIETKSPGKHLSPDQLKFAGLCRRIGVPYVVVDSVELGMSEIKKRLKTFVQEDLQWKQK